MLRPPPFTVIFDILCFRDGLWVWDFVVGLMVQAFVGFCFHGGLDGFIELGLCWVCFGFNRLAGQRWLKCFVSLLG